MSKKTRHNVVLPDELYVKLSEEARKRQASVVELIRRYISIGLVLTEIENSPDKELIIREKDHESRLIII